jgi:hypothetical protein
MNYVQARYYLASFTVHYLLWAFPKKYRLTITLWAASVVMKTLRWKIENGHTK